MVLGGELIPNLHKLKKKECFRKLLFLQLLNVIATQSNENQKLNRASNSFPLNKMKAEQDIECVKVTK